MSYTIEEFDSVKTKVLKYIMYKKRTEKEVRQKFSSSVDENLYSKGVNNAIIEQYIQSNIEELKEYEQQCAQKIYYKKQPTMEKEDIINFLRKKGYTSETIRNLEE